MENNLTKTEQTALLIQQEEAKFALSPVGQALKQFEITQRMGQMYGASTIVPDTYRNNVANCAIACDMALRMNVPPVLVMQNLYIVHGNPAWSSKFLVGCVNGCGRFTPLEYHFKTNVASDAPEYGCRCVAYAKDDVKRERPLEGAWITWKMVKGEGWDKKSGSKWLTMPDQMFRYRAAAFWQRTYAPELSLGIMTAEEAYDGKGIVDAEFEEVKTEEKHEKPLVVSQQVLDRALDTLAKASTADEVLAIREGNKFVYENSELFRAKCIDKMESLIDENEIPL